MTKSGKTDWVGMSATLQALLDAGVPRRQIAERIGVPPDTLRRRIADLRARGHITTSPQAYGTQSLPVLPPERTQSRDLQVKFPDKKRSSFDVDRFLTTMIDYQDQLQAKSVSQKEATVTLRTDEPFAVAFTADWHVGSATVDYTKLWRHLKLILDVPNLYFGAVGDMMDNFVKAKIKSAMLHQLFGPQEQHDVLREIFRRIGHKCLFTTAGNHDDWTDSEAGIDIAASFYDSLQKAPYLRHGGGITLDFAEGVSYRIYAKHKYSFNSRLNRTHAAKRMHEIESPYDVGVLAHTHTPSTEHTDRWSGAYAKQTIHIVTGTYKVEDGYAQANGYGASAQAVSPTVIFFPHEKRMIPFHNIEDAALVLQALKTRGGADDGF